MALILLANTKGGSGKTTAALVLAGELLTHNARIVLLEGDPNRPLVSWAETRGAAIIETSKHRAKSADEARKIIEEAAGDTERLVVIHDDDQEGVFEWIEGASAWAHFVIADPEGSPNEWLTDVASQADLVLIPFAPQLWMRARSRAPFRCSTRSQSGRAGRSTTAYCSPEPTRSPRAMNVKFVKALKKMAFHF